MYLESRVQHTAFTPPWCSLHVCPRRPEQVSHTWTMRSAPQVASLCPSGENSTPVTLRECPYSPYSSENGGAASASGAGPAAPSGGGMASGGRRSSSLTMSVPAFRRVRRGDVEVEDASIGKLGPGTYKILTRRISGRRLFAHLRGASLLFAARRGQRRRSLGVRWMTDAV